MAEVESEEAVQLRNKVFEMAKSTSSIALPSRGKSVSEQHKELDKGLSKMVSLEEPKSTYVFTKSLSEMAIEDPIRLQNQSCGIREDIVKVRDGKRLIYSSLARLSTFSIGLSSTEGEDPSGAPRRKSSVDPKDKSPPRYFQMPELGARVFVGDVDGSDTIACHLSHGPRYASKIDLDSEYAALWSLYKLDRPGGLSGWVQAQPAHFRIIENHLSVILSGTELFVSRYSLPVCKTMVGNLGGKSSSVFDIQPRALIPSVYYNRSGHWESFEGSGLLRSSKGPYLEEPKFMDEKNYRHPKFDHTFKGDVLQLTRFDDFVILGNYHLHWLLPRYKVNDIVRKNASQTADVIAAQILKAAIEERLTTSSDPIIAIVVVLDHKEILLREHKKEKKESMATKEEEETITTSKEEKKIFALEKEDKKGIMMEDHKLGMKLATTSSNLPSGEVQDDLEASFHAVLMNDDNCKSEEFMVSCHITKWIIYGDEQEKTLLCFFNVGDEQYEFYFEDHESMATIIGLGVPHSKVVLKCENPHVIVVEIPEEDWNAKWTQSNDIPQSIPKGNDLKQKIFPDILHRIANIITINNIVSKANNGGVVGDNGKGKVPGNVDDSKGKGKAEDYDNHGNIGHPNGGSNRPPNNNDNKERKGKDGNDDKNDGGDGDDGKASNDGKEVQVIVSLLFWPGGVLEEKRKELWAVHEEEVEGKKMKLGEILEEEVEEKKKEFREGHKGVEKKKKKFPALWPPRKQGNNGNVVEVQHVKTTIEQVEDGNVHESLLKQLKEQIYAEMVFTFTIKYEVGGPFKTIQATINYIEFQFPSNNKENYSVKRRFGWFHKELEVAFGVVDKQAATLDAKSRKVLDSSEVEEGHLQGTSKENARTSTNAYKAKVGFNYVATTRFDYDRTNGLGDKRIDEVQNSCKSNRMVTKGDFSFSDHTNLCSQQLKYLFRPRSPFKEEEFEDLNDEDRLDMYHRNPICQTQQVSCEGTWRPYNSRKLEEYKLEASRELKMTKIYNPKLEIVEEKKQKGVSKVERNLPLCFIQKLEKVVYLNHAMSHLTSSTAGKYYLRTLDVESNSTFLTQLNCEEEPKWPNNDPFLDVKQ